MSFDRSSSYHDTITRRREMVARLRVRGLTVREIADSVARAGIVNTKTKEPFTFQTIANDLEALRGVWHENAAVSTDEHKARQLAEIEEIKRLAWKNNDGGLALSAIDKEMKLLGTSAPTKIDFGVSVDKLLVFLDSVRKLGHDPEKFIDRTNERARQLVQ